MQIEITTDPISPWQRLDSYQQQMPGLVGKVGASAVFVGSMRDFNEDESISAMRLEHYPAMTLKYLQDLVNQTMQQWSLLDVLLLHRVGEVTPGDTIVLVAVWSAHRAEAFAACRHLMEELKSRAPFWKQETLREGGRRWVGKNTPG
ncbi:MAG: molybdenum cofactor biosynthesis protein MoaE [Gammaproteobacteria bacterium]|jgi:molybdopterin synthase catalytic subunit